MRLHGIPDSGLKRIVGSFGALVEVSTLIPTEAEQDRAKITRIRDAMGDDLSAIDWDEVPAIIIDEERNILDGHHRALAVMDTLGVWRALYVDRSEWDRLVEEGGYTAAIKQVADDYDDPVTWGAA